VVSRSGKVYLENRANFFIIIIETKRRKQEMKKIICLLAVVLMIASVVYAAPKIKITAKDLPSLKGTWEGILSFGAMEQGTSPVKLEILNDTVPVRAKLTITKVPDQLAQRLAITTGAGGQVVMESDEGALTTAGTIMFTGPQKNFLELTKTGDKKIGLWYYWMGLKGDADLKKK